MEQINYQSVADQNLEFIDTNRFTIRLEAGFFCLHCVLHNVVLTDFSGNERLALRLSLLVRYEHSVLPHLSNRLKGSRV